LFTFAKKGFVKLVNYFFACTIQRQSIFLLEQETEPDSKKWPDIRPTGYPVHP